MFVRDARGTAEHQPHVHTTSCWVLLTDDPHLLMYIEREVAWAHHQIKAPLLAVRLVQQVSHCVVHPDCVKVRHHH
jgi:hypothetical protein